MDKYIHGIYFINIHGIFIKQYIYKTEYYLIFRVNYTATQKNIHEFGVEE